MTKYIDKAGVIAEIKKIREHVIRLRYAVDANCIVTIRNACECLESSIDLFVNSIDTLEVKEVDLDNDLIEEVYSHLDGIKDIADRMTSGNFMHNKGAIKFSANTITKVLELIGLNAQKGE